MILNQDYAMIYDTGLFANIYFNKEFFANSANHPENYDSDKALYFYNKLASTLPELPTIIAPFFKHYNRTTTITPIFESRIPMDEPTIDMFTGFLIANQIRIRQEVVRHAFPDRSNINNIMPDSNSEEFVKALEASYMPESEKYQLTLLLGNFKYGISVLCSTLKQIYSEVVALHKSEAELIDRKYNDIINDPENIVAAELKRLGVKVASRKKLSISLLNPYAIVTDENQNALTGLYCDEMISGQKTMKSLPAAIQFIDTCGSKLRLQMLEALMEKTEMSLSEFARYTNMQSATVIHNVRAMLENNVLEVSRVEPKSIYYKINKQFLAQAKYGIDIMFSKLIEKE